MKPFVAFFVAVALATCSCFFVGVSWGSFVGSIHSTTRDDIAVLAGVGASSGLLALVTGIGSLLHAVIWGLAVFPEKPRRRKRVDPSVDDNQNDRWAH